MNKNYETILPEGYREAFVVDAKDRKTIIGMNIAATAFTVLGIIAVILIYRPSYDDIFSWRYFAAFAGLMLYLVLHELTHGLVYKL